MNNWIDKHSVNCYFCGKLVDERDCQYADKYNNNDGGHICQSCLTSQWQLTDYDNQQYGRCIDDFTFEFKEFDRGNYNLDDELTLLGEADFYDKYFFYDEYWIIEKIDLRDYTLEQQKKYYEAYYPENEFNTLTNWIIAECIFEQESGLY